MPEELSEGKVFHGHLGPYLAIGMKMGKLILSEFGAGRATVNIEALTGLNPPVSCILDGLQITTSSTIGNGKLSARPQGNSQPRVVARIKGRSLTLQVREDLVKKIKAQCNAKTEEMLAQKIWESAEEDVFHIETENRG